MPGSSSASTCLAVGISTPRARYSNRDGLPFSSLRGFMSVVSLEAGMPSSGESAFAVAGPSLISTGSAKTYRASTLWASGSPVRS